jgi:hypothetical protein
MTLAIRSPVIRKVAVVSHDYNLADSHGLYDYSEHFSRINKLCDEQGCDTILYALFTWDKDSEVARTHSAIFDGLIHVHRVVLELWQEPGNPKYVEVWQRDERAPAIVYQRFAASSDPDAYKQEFVADFPKRQFADSLLVVCGETNIASLVRATGEFNDPYRFADRLREISVRVILNPIHDYMRRYEMREKRRHYSLGGRTVISVWNRGKGKESALPWTVFHDGEERTEAVRELPTPFPDRPDIRIGIVEVPALFEREGAAP